MTKEVKAECIFYADLFKKHFENYSHREVVDYLMEFATSRPIKDYWEKELGVKELNKKVEDLKQHIQWMQTIINDLRHEKLMKKING